MANILFAIDTETDEVIVSESQKGSNKIDFVERVKKGDDVILYNAVVTLASLTTASDFDAPIFKAMDKVCQMLYTKYKEKS
ncbi:MAG: hypothetical protein L6262_11970 [Weeksellaceae bacterium]|nr:hypothetical protein [Weeksellaceae bacterium]